MRQKAKRQRARNAPTFQIDHGLPTPGTVANILTPHSDATSSSSEGSTDLCVDHLGSFITFESVNEAEPSTPDALLPLGASIPFSLKPTADELAATYFFSQFTAKSGHWTILREHAGSFQQSRVVDLAIKACGMAALDNVQAIPRGRHYARALYGEAVTHLNAALRDPRRCKTDESLMVVALLGYYEVGARMESSINRLRPR